MKLTFINAFVSSPVHCLNPRPLGNRLIPEKGAASDILQAFEHKSKKMETLLPIINLI